jgi:MFS family permease
MSLLNLLSDWTCYSVAPIALLTEEAFGDINAEQLVVVFLGANVIATACEPIILSRLGLRRTVLFGALLLMMGSIVKSGGMPPIIQSSLPKGKGEWRVYVGFFLVGLSQPLYQCTPALLSASWFPEEERTMATSVALNANQLGIGFAFIFGTLLVATSDDIPRYFGLLSLISTLTFLGALLQFDDAPPTPPSDTARVMRGTLEVKLPTVQNILDTVRGNLDRQQTSKSSTTAVTKNNTHRKSRSSHRKKHNPDTTTTAHRRRRREQQPEPPSPAPWDDPVTSAAPSPMMPGTVGEDSDTPRSGYPEQPSLHSYHLPYPDVPVYPPYVMYGQPQQAPYAFYPPYGQQQPPPQWGDPRNLPAYPRYPPHVDPYYQYYSYQHGILPPPPHIRGYASSHNVLPMAGGIDEGAEPGMLTDFLLICRGYMLTSLLIHSSLVITITPHHCDIEIRDDQIILSMKACLARPGFIHSLVSFTVSGIVINTLSTFMDYLVRLNGASRAYTGIVGGAFQFCIMISSLIVGRVCDNTRAYYSITIGMLVLGAFGLAECGVSLDSNSGSTLRYALVVVAVLVGPLQPVSTELGVDVVYPLSENTVLVIQQLFSNLLSAAFIPCFKAMRDIGAATIEDGATVRPQYTFSFYLLIVLHAAATVFFATFNGRYLRYEHELEKKAKEERRKQRRQAKAFRHANHERHQSFESARGEHLPPPPFI